MPKRKRTDKKQNTPKHAVWWIRWTNTILVTLVSPIIFLGFIYLLLFFILNSSYAPQIFHGQLSNFLRGDFTADRLSTDALLRRLTLTNVVLAETGHTDHVVKTPKLVAKIPIEELLDLVTKNTFRLGDVVVYDPDVVLDFSKGELNILRVVLPYFSKPDPPDPVPSDFVTFLSDMSVVNGEVHLIFDGFRIDLSGTDVDHYALKTSATLWMNSPKAEKNGGKRGVRAKKAEVRFNPALFSFALSSVGDASEGLVLSGGSGASGAVGYGFSQMSRHLGEILRRSPEYREKLPEPPEMRGDFVVRLEDFQVDNYHWDGDTMYIPAVDAVIGNGGKLVLRDAMMNVGPKQADIDAMQKETGHKPSGLLPQESILWAAKLDLQLGVEDPILNYFFGPVLHGDSMFRLRADMRGDLARVSGDVSLDMDAFDTFDIDIARLALRANMDGQHVTIHALEADTLIGAAAVSGFYEIMDGNFDVDLWAGTVPEKDKFRYIDPDFKSRLADGMTPLEILPDGEIKQLGGTLRTHLQARSQDGIISVLMPEPLEYKLDEPLLDIEKLEMKPMSNHGRPILTYAGSDIGSPAGLMLDFGVDTIKIAPGLRVDLKDITRSTGGVTAHVEDPAFYATSFGLGDVIADPIDLDVRYENCGSKLCGGIDLKTGNIAYMGIEVPVVDIDLDINQSDIVTKKFKIETSIADINADIHGKLLPKMISTPAKAPFDAKINISGVDFATLDFDALKDLGLKGHGGGTIQVTGPVDDLKAGVQIVFEDIEAMEIPVSRLALNARYEDNQILVPRLNIWFDEAANRANEEITDENGHVSKPKFRRPDFSINTLTCDLTQNTIVFNTYLSPVSPNKFKPFRDLGLPVEVDAGFDLAVNIDLNWLFGTGSSKSRLKSYKSTWIEGSVELNRLRYADLNLGNTQLQFSRSAQFALVKGSIIDLLSLSGYVRTSPNLAASISLDFPDLNVLSALDSIGIDIEGIKKDYNIQRANVSGSIGFCMKDLDNMRVSVLLDDVDASVLGNPLTLSQPALIRADLKKMSVQLSQFELKYRDTILKINGGANKNGDVDLDINGEIDAALARSFVKQIKQSSGLLAINLSAHGNIFKNGRINFNDMDIAGYFGVRDPIQVLTDLASAPIEMSKGFLRIDNKHPDCGKHHMCVYTPDDQPFTVGINGQWVELSLFTGTHGRIAVDIGGTINAAIAQLFVKDISSAKGAISLSAAAEGKFIDKNGNFNIDLHNFTVGGELAVVDPILVELRSMADPIDVSGGILKVTEGADCLKRGQCVVIPADNAFRGSIMGGDFIILGEVARDVIIPKGGYLSVTANNVNFRMKDELTVTASPDIQITAKDFTDFETVKVAGNIDIAEAKYKRNFDDGSSNFIKDQILSMFIDSRRRVATYSPSFLRKMPDLGKIRFDVGIAAENSINVDVKIAGATVELELGAQARIGGTITEIAPTGIFSINTGLFSMNDNDFDFQSGSQIAFNGSLDGKIDITASAEISTDSNAFGAVTGNTDLDRRKRISSSSSNASSDLYAITLTVGGSLFQPNWSFESSPYLSDANVYALILTGKTIDDFSGNDIAMESLLSPLFSSQLDSFIDADQFKFLFSEGAAQFVYVKQITKALRIAAGVSIRGSEGNEQALSAEYYFNDNWFVDLTGQNTSDEEGRAPTFKLGARFHWHLAIE